MIREHDRIVLTAPVPNEELEIGAVGTVVHVYSDGGAFEVEFITLWGETVSVVTVSAGAVRPVAPKEIAHARAVA